MICAPFIRVFEGEESVQDPFESYVKRRKTAMEMRALGLVATSGLSFELSGEEDPKSGNSLHINGRTK